MLTNKELLAILKAQITTGTGGMASAQDVEEFIDLSREQTEVLLRVRVENGIRTGLNLYSLELTEPAMIAATEATAPVAGDIVEPNANKKTLSPVEVIAAYDISFDFLRRNIRRDSVNEDLNMLFAKRWGKDVVQLILNGDTSNVGSTRSDKLIKILDGILVKADGDVNIHEVIVAGTDYKDVIFKQMLQALPKDYRDDRSVLAYFVSQNVYDEYEDQVGGRATPLGDAILTGRGSDRIPYKRVEILPVYGMPDDQHILTPMSNIVVGFGDEMTFGTDIENRERLMKVTITGSLDTNYVVSDAVVLRKAA